MYHTMTSRLAFAMMATMAGSPTFAADSGMRTECGKTPAPIEGKVPLTSMRSKTPLYVMDKHGRLVRMNLDTGARTVLSDHGPGMLPTLHASGDGRWLSYSGVLEGTDKAQYWLYDRHKDTEQLVYENPTRDGSDPVFSPDSRYLAISGAYDSQRPNASHAGIYLFDTTTMRLRAVPLPTLKTNRSAWVSADWSRDGKMLLIRVRNMSAKEGVDYVSYRPDTEQIEALSDHYNWQAARHDVRRGEIAIPTFEEVKPRSDLGTQSAWSSGHNWHAHIDEAQDGRLHLFVTSKKGVTKPVAVGEFDQCAGPTLAINGWLDERHLVYRNAMDHAIFDAQAGKRADLFNESDMPHTFTW